MHPDKYLMSSLIDNISWNNSQSTLEHSPRRSSRFPSPETSKNQIMPSVVSKPRASTPYPRRRPSFITTSPSFSLTRNSKVNCFPSYSHEKVGQSKRMNNPPNTSEDSYLSENGQLSNRFPNVVSETHTIKDGHASFNASPPSKHTSTFPATQHAQTTNW